MSVACHGGFSHDVSLGPLFLTKCAFPCPPSFLSPPCFASALSTRQTTKMTTTHEQAEYRILSVLLIPLADLLSHHLNSTEVIILMTIGQTEKHTCCTVPARLEHVHARLPLLSRTKSHNFVLHTRQHSIGSTFCSLRLPPLISFIIMEKVHRLLYVMHATAYSTVRHVVTCSKEGTPRRGQDEVGMIMKR